MKTYRYFLNDIQETLNKTYDDSTYPLTHILYLTIAALNDLNFQIVDKRKNGQHLSVFDVTSITDMGTYGEFELPTPVFNLSDDKGVSFLHGTILDDDLHHPFRFHRINPASLRILNMSVTTRPSMLNPYFYLVGNTVRTLGVNCTDMLTLELGLYSPLKVNPDCSIEGNDFSLDDKIPVDDEKLNILRYRVLEACRFGLQLRGDNINDGRDRLSVSQQPVPETTEQQRGRSDEGQQQQNAQQQ